MYRTARIKLHTAGHTDIIDITEMVADIVLQSGVLDGIATIFVPGSTASVTTIEYESGLIADLKEALGRLAPAGPTYHHDLRWGDGNGHSHVRAALLGPSVCVPIARGHLTLGTWQQIILIDMDNHPRAREVIVQVLGE